MILDSYREYIMNNVVVAERMKPYSYKGFMVHHYVINTEQFIACKGARVLRDTTKVGIEQKIDEQ